MQVKLKVLGGSHSGKEILVRDEKFFIGRSDSCQLRPKSDSISRKHCAILQRDGKVIVADLKSRNGTFLNDSALEPERAKVMASGDVLRVGQLEFEVVIEHSIGGAKKPEVSSVKEAATRMVSDATQTEPKTDSFDIADWLIEADTMDRGGVRRPFIAEPETKMIAMDETANVQVTQEVQVPDEAKKDDSAPKINRVDNSKGPMKLPKQMKSGPSTQNSRVAAEETLKKFFGGR
jgi:predicted component of type VI protein secretion system